MYAHALKLDLLKPCQDAFGQDFKRLYFRLLSVLGEGGGMDSGREKAAAMEHLVPDRHTVYEQNHILTLTHWEHISNVRW